MACPQNYPGTKDPPASKNVCIMRPLLCTLSRTKATSRRAAVKIAKAAEQIKAMKKKLEANGA